METPMKRGGVLAIVGLLAACSAQAADQTQIGAGNGRAEQIGQKSPLVQSAIDLLEDNARRIKDAKVRESTLDSFLNPKTCVRHRIGVNDSVKAQMLATLVSQGLVNPADAASITGGLKAGVFPPLALEGTQCPHLPLSFAATPGSSFGGHHSYPGGLAVTETPNYQTALNFAATFRCEYGQQRRRQLPVAKCSRTAGD